MATYYHGNSEIQGDGLQTLILMNPGYVGFSDTQQPPPPPQPGNFVFLNSTSTGNSINPASFTHAPPHHPPQLVGIPLQSSVTATAPGSSQDAQPPSFDVSALHGFIPRVQYNMYNPADPTTAREFARATQGLSLSLSPQQPAYGSSFKSDLKVPSAAHAPLASGGEDVRVSGGSPTSGVSNGANGMQSVLLSSKYLKVTQELLEEVVNVGKGFKNESTKGNSKTSDQECLAAGTSPGDGSGGRDSGGKRSVELTTAERQEIQMKKAKLVNMLDEVEQRYRQYHHQMQIVISWFEQVAGHGSAKTYTALALQTISKQFRCLKDAISGQIRSASKSLGEEECLGGGGKMEGGSRLKYVDHQLRQQRALQQLGMIQHNAWRPQRGLPERSVSVLRAWLFEHFLHPYPKDSDKHMLAKQTGLTRSQVSNWFINARVRLWKPMVEEMYMEEIKEQEQNASGDKATKSKQNEDSASKSSPPLQEKTPLPQNPNNNNFNFKQDNNPQNTPTASLSTTSPTGSINPRNQSGFTLIGSPEMESIPQSSPKKQRNSEILQSPIGDGFTLMGAPTNFIGGFGSYPIGDIGRFGSEQFATAFSGNGVSLTLGLPHCENLPISGNHHHQGFLPNQSIHLGRRVEISQPNDFGASTTPTSSHSTTAFDGIAHQNRKRFAAQLLPDYVA